MIRAWTETPLEGQPVHDRHGPAGKGLPFCSTGRKRGSFRPLWIRPSKEATTIRRRSPITATDVLWMEGLWRRSLASCWHFPAGEGPEKGQREKTAHSVDYFRDLPNGGDLNASYALGSGLGLCTPEHYMAARLLRLVTLGSLEPEADGQDRISLRLLREPHGGMPMTRRSISFWNQPAGGDSVLREPELERFCEDSAGERR